MVISGVLAKTQKEKVVRVAVATLRNILELSKGSAVKENVENMVANNILRQMRGVQVLIAFFFQMRVFAEWNRESLPHRYAL